jgi:protein transport protein SEC24
MTCAMGSAMKAAYKMLGAIGGKIIVMLASIPNEGEGALKPREDPKLFGTASESGLLSPANSWFKSFAIDCSKDQVSVDLFLFGTQYLDAATISISFF